VPKGRLILGIILTAIGVWFVSIESTSHSICSSGLVSNPAVCSGVNGRYYGGIAGAVVGVLCIGSYLFSRRGEG
jgi:hypothetical protein